MRIREDNINTELDIRNKEGLINSEFYFFFARPRYGKSLSIEALVEMYHKAGFTILCLSDVKNLWELGFAMFKPKRKYHLDRLKKDGTEPSIKKVKLYHPFTFSIPKGKLPDINFYGFSLKELGREEYSLISESAWESETTRLLLNASNTIPDDYGLYKFLHYIQDSIGGKKEGKILKPDPKNFYLTTTGGIAKSLVEVASYFLPFKKHYFLLPHDSKLKLNWEEILNDNEHYHVFGTKYLEDDKLKEFCVMTLLQLIIDNQNYARKPILIYIPEIRFLVPLRPQGYKYFLASSIKNNLSTMGNLGVGFSAVCDSQVWSDVDENVKNTATKTFFGEMGGGKDFENIIKSLKYTREDFKYLQDMEVAETSIPAFILQNNPKIGAWTPRFPTHCHAEEEYKFEEMYKKFYPEKMKDYDGLKLEMKNFLLSEEKEIRENIKRKEKEEKELEEQKKAEKEQRKAERESSKAKVDNNKEKESRTKNTLMKLAYEMFNDESLEKKHRTYRKIAEKLGLPKSSGHKTAKKYIEEYSEQLKEENPEVKSNYNEVRKEIYESVGEKINDIDEKEVENNGKDSS